MVKKIFVIILDTLSSFIRNDALFLKIKYRLKMGVKLNLSEPFFFTEKLQWLKLYDHNPLYTTLVDKYEVKKYIAQIIGDKYVVPLLGVWSQFDDIDFDSLPNKFVLKTTHSGGSSGVVICKDKKTFNYEKARILLTKSLKHNIYWSTREWPYKSVSRRIIAEQYLENGDEDLKDYKFYCFNGIPRVLLVASNRFTLHNFNYFDMEFNDLPIVSRDGPRSVVPMEKPINFEEMVHIAKKLSTGIPHVRVDLYNVEGHVYFGELTLYDSSGYDDMSSEEWNETFGNWLVLPN